MEFTKVQLNGEVAVGKTFEFPTQDIETVDYGSFYNQVCKGMNPTKSFGIYEVADDITKFTVAIHTEVSNDLKSFEMPAGQFYEFEIDMMENMKDNQYVKCFAALEAAGVEYDMSYSIEIMGNDMNPETGQMKYKYYIKAN